MVIIDGPFLMGIAAVLSSAAALVRALNELRRGSESRNRQRSLVLRSSTPTSRPKLTH